MATFYKRSIEEVPRPDNGNPKFRKRRHMYEEFIRSVGYGLVGELTLEDKDTMRGTKVLLRRASTRLNRNLYIWDRDGKVYFSRER